MAIAKSASLNQDYTVNALASGWLLGRAYRPVRLIGHHAGPITRSAERGRAWPVPSAWAVTVRAGKPGSMIRCCAVRSNAPR
jgi:hypothetical protein